MSSPTRSPSVKRKGFMYWIRQRRINKNWQFYAMLLLPLVWYFVFCYMPMPGVVLAFKKYSAMKGVYGSPFANPWYKWFLKYYQSPYFSRTIGNTFYLSFLSLLLGFPLPILLALLLNEVRNRAFQEPGFPENSAEYHLHPSLPFHRGSGGHDDLLYQPRFRHCQQGH